MKKVLATVLVLCMLLTCASFPAMAETTNPYRVKIFTMGDSFTEGVIEPNAYRYYIYENLIKDGAVFQFIGKQSSGDFRVTSLYNKHGGVGGAVIGHSEDVKWNGSSWVTSSWEYTNPETGKTIKYGGTKNSIWYRLFAGSDGSNDYTKTEYGNYVKEADIVTLYIGLNDYYSSGATGLSADIEHVKQRYITVVKRIFEINPEVSLYITTLNEVGGLRGYGLKPGDEGYENSLYEYNDFILNFTTNLAGDEELAPYLDQITSVSLNQEGYKMGSGDTPSDDGHPNNKGNRKIGTQIYMAIKDEVLALNEQEGDAYNPTRVTSLSLDKTSLTLKTGENATVTSTIAPLDAEIISVIFSSSDESVATIDDYGRITAVGAGTANIYATALDSLRPGATEIKAVCTVTVTSEQHTNVGDNFLPVLTENFSTTSPWIGSTELIATASKAYKHTTSNASSQITSKITYDLKEGFSMSFKAALMGSATKEVNASNKASYYTSLKVGKYELRVAVNGKVISFYYEGELVNEKIFEVAPVRQNDDKYTLTKYEDKVYVYRNNELLFTSDVNKYDTTEGNVVLKVVGYATRNIRDLEIKSIYGLKEITPTIKYSSTATTHDGNNYPATNAIDGNLSTRYSIFAWKGASPEAWDSPSNYLILDLGDEYDISDLNIYWGGHPSGVWGATAPDAYNVSYSSDNVTYTPALSYSGIHAIINGEATETFTSNTTSFAMNYPSWAGAADRTTYSYGTVKEAELGWEGVRYIKIQMTSINRNPSISEIEVYTKAYLEGEEPEGTTANYTVTYVDNNGNELAPSKTSTGFIGAKVTEKAVEVEGYFPDEETKSIIVAESDNSIVFVYEPIPEKLPLTGESLIAQSGFGWTNGDRIEGSAAVLFDGEDATNTKAYITHAYFSNKTFSGSYWFELDLGSELDLSHMTIQGGSSDWNYSHLVAYDVYAAGSDKVYGDKPIASVNKNTDGSINHDNLPSSVKIRTDEVELKTNDIRYLKIVIKEAYRRPCLGEIEVYRSLEPNPKKVETTYTVNYVDEDGNSLFEPKTETGFVGDSVTEEPANVPGYTADAATKTITLVEGTNTITFTYTKNPELPAVFGEVPEIQPILSATARVDSQNHPITNAFDGKMETSYIMDWVDAGNVNQSIVLTLDGYYDLSQLNIVWGGELGWWGEAAMTNGSISVSTDGSAYTEVEAYTTLEVGEVNGSGATSYHRIDNLIFPEVFKNVKYVKITIKKASNSYPTIHEITLNGVLTANGKPATTYTVNYIDANGNPITDADKDVVSCAGDIVIATAKNVAGYKAEESRVARVLGTENNVIDIVYTEMEKATYTVNYLDENGKPVADAKTVNAYIGEKYTEEALNLYSNGYFLDGYDFAKTIVPVEGTNEITFTYKKIINVASSTGALFNGAAGLWNKSRIYNGLIDGDYDQINSTGWTGGTVAEIVFKFDKATNVESLITYQGSSNANQVEIYLSNDGTTWGEPVYAGVSENKSVSVKTVASSLTVYESVFEINAKAQYVKYVITDIDKAWCALREFVFVKGEEPLPVVTEDAVESLGANIRLGDNDLSAGLRFGAEIDKAKAGLTETYKYDDEQVVKFGMFLLPKNMLGEGQTLTQYLANGVQDALDVVAKKIKAQDENTIEYTAVLVDIPEKAWDRVVVAVPYALVGDNYIFFDEQEQSYAGVAQAAIDSYLNGNPNNISEEQYNSLLEILAKVQG